MTTPRFAFFLFFFFSRVSDLVVFCYVTDVDTWEWANHTHLHVAEPFPDMRRERVTLSFSFSFSFLSSLERGGFSWWLFFDFSVTFTIWVFDPPRLMDCRAAAANALTHSHSYADL